MAQFGQDKFDEGKFGSNPVHTGGAGVPIQPNLTIDTFSPKIHLPLDPSCVLDLDGRDVHGSRIFDRSIKGNHGAITGAVIKPMNYGLPVLDLNGTTDHINCGHDDSLDITSEITISLWMKADVLDGYLLQKNLTSASDGQYGVYTGADDNLTYYPTSSLATPANSLKARKWIFVTLTRTAAGIGQFYIDGQPSGSSGAIAMPSKPSYNLVIGRRNPDDFYFNGQVAMCQILNRALTASEISQRFQNIRHIFGT